MLWGLRASPSYCDPSDWAVGWGRDQVNPSLDGESWIGRMGWPWCVSRGATDGTSPKRLAGGWGSGEGKLPGRTGSVQRERWSMEVEASVAYVFSRKRLPWIGRAPIWEHLNNAAVLQARLSWCPGSMPDSLAAASQKGNLCPTFEVLKIRTRFKGKLQIITMSHTMSFKNCTKLVWSSTHSNKWMVHTSSSNIRNRSMILELNPFQQVYLKRHM